ncbi:Rho GTPase-activating protein 44 [Geodia barretti]|uniref:Rho GTPase-activating protein 44 n=1 Tax=Geodia barretti TaxID=519541 RepID=A0AA35RL66_GEOBA|nr:Rho GTPase-activating protein 44 [Geodia barretti]
MSLEEHGKLSKREVALVIQDCVEALRDGCLDTEGLFRIAGSATKVKFLKNSFNAHQRNAKDHDPHTVAGCLKRYLRELPEPILTYELYAEFMSSVQLADTSTTLQKMKDLLSQLPPSHNATLKYLLAFLHEFAQYHEMTKMTTGNIAIVMGPNLLWPEGDMSEDAAAVVSDTAVQRRVAELLIDKVHWFFPDLPDTPTPAPPIKQATHVSSHGVNPSGVYTPTGPLSSYGTPPPTSPSPADSTPSSSTSSSITEDLQSNTSPSQTTPPLHITHETLAEMRSSSPKPANVAPPPIRPRPYRGSGPMSSGQQTPPSPSPRSGSFTRPASSESFTRPASSEISNCMPVDPTDDIGEGSLANQRPEEPTIK